MSNNDESKAGFNMAIATLIRIDSVLKRIQIYALSENLEGWRDALNQLRREISPYIETDELKTLSKSLKELKDLKWVEVDKLGRKVYVEDKIEKAEELLDSITIDCQKAMFKAHILMAIKENESSGGYD